jgi:hypothetical protein
MYGEADHMRLNQETPDAAGKQITEGFILSDRYRGATQLVESICLLSHVYVWSSKRLRNATRAISTLDRDTKQGHKTLVGREHGSHYHLPHFSGCNRQHTRQQHVGRRGGVV